MESTPVNGQMMLGQLSMNLIESLEKDYGSDFNINIAGIIVDVSWKDEDDNLCTQLNFKATDPRRWVQEALFRKGAEIARKNS